VAKFFDEVRSVGDMARVTAREYGDRPAILTDDATWTHGAIDTASSALAALLVDRGLRGSRCAVVMENVPEQIAVYYGSAKAGMVETAVNVRHAPPEVAYQVHHSQAEVVITSPTRWHLLSETFTRESSVRRVVLVPDPLHPVGDLAAYDAPVDVEVADLAAIEGDDPGVDVQPDDWHIIWYTSGTTGKPKGAVHRHGASTLATGAWIDTWQLGPDDRGVAGNLFHVGCQAAVFGFLAAGGSAAMLSNVFSIEAVLEEIEKKRITFFPGIQVMYALLAMRPELLEGRDLSSLNKSGYGSSPTDSELVLKMMDLLPQIEWYHMYGQSESNTGGCCLLPEDHRRKLGSVGKPIPCVEALTIQDDDGKVLGPGERGEVCLRGATVMVGYLDDPDATARTVVDGWLHTGDVGYLDEEGFLFLVDRKKDVIIRGGENVYPAEVEAVLRTHPAVAEVSVVAIPDKVMGETPMAFVAKRPDADLSDDDMCRGLEELATANLARYKRPVAIEVVEALPRSAMGKVLKYELRERAKVHAR